MSQPMFGLLLKGEAQHSLSPQTLELKPKLNATRPSLQAHEVHVGRCRISGFGN